MDIKEHLKQKGIDDRLVVLIEKLASACVDISCVVEAGKMCDKAGTCNTFGEEQLALDVASDRLISAVLNKCEDVAVYASEELEEEIKTGHDSQDNFGVAYDPLDGSSLVNVNLAVGSIFGIYKCNTFIGKKGDDQECAMIAVYGPRTTIVCATKAGAHEYTLCDGKFNLTKENLHIDKEGKIFAPGNLRACLYNPGYRNLLNYWLDKQYTLRYSGGMVPDINHILLKGKGLFTYPGYKDMPDGKLRLLYECAPMAYIVEHAGGKATDGKIRLLEKAVTSLSQRTPILIGSETEVMTAEEMLK
ncbi:MAG: class 1 fructose-bisphosphatase [Candidatus Gracilibacteria bacterium]|jgi:fructose-1,6-bisphosphatase I